MKDFCSYCAEEKEVAYKTYQLPKFKPKRTYVCSGCEEEIKEIIRVNTQLQIPSYPAKFTSWLRRDEIAWRENIPGRKKTSMR